MAVSAFESAWAGPHLGDRDGAALFADAAEVAAMVRVEAALAGVQGRLGVIPAAAGEVIAAALEGVVVDPRALGAGMAGSGVPVPALVAALRAIVGGDAAQYLHWGATTQDIVDTGLVLRLRQLCDLLGARLQAVIAALAGQAREHRDLVMAARTWGQPATPTTFGLRIAGWLVPLIRHRDRLLELRPRLLVVSCGGASGTMAAMGEHGPAVEAALAEALGLGVPPKPWHAERDGVAELAGWLSLVTGSLGKMGTDLKLMAASGAARAGAAGGSSTMPQKANPVGAEALVALARQNAALLGALHGALIHAEERDAAAWSAEWLCLPQMAVAAGASLRHALELARTLRPNPAAMQAEIAATRGTLLAEAAQFALAAHMPRPEAQTAVKEAAAGLAPGEDLGSALRRRVGKAVAERIDWEALGDPARHTGAAAALVDRVLAQVPSTPARPDFSSGDRRSIG
jgi:3-carboxy-cis,cis-muconate cycloisomerase